MIGESYLLAGIGRGTIDLRQDQDLLTRGGRSWRPEIVISKRIEAAAAGWGEGTGGALSNSNGDGLGFEDFAPDRYLDRSDCKLPFLLWEQDIDKTFRGAGRSVDP